MLFFQGDPLRRGLGKLKCCECVDFFDETKNGAAKQDIAAGMRRYANRMHPVASTKASATVDALLDANAERIRIST